MKREKLILHSEELNNKALKLQGTTDRLLLSVKNNNGSDVEKKNIQLLKFSIIKQVEDILSLSKDIGN